MNILKPLFVKATSLSDAWFQTLYRCVEMGREFIIDRGSYEGQKRLEFDFATIQITHPETLPLLPKVNPLLGFPDPVEDGYLGNYLPYLMTGADKIGESYTYGKRICEENIANMLQDVDAEFLIPESKISTNNPGVVVKPGVSIFNGNFILSQMELMIWTYKKKGHRNNQMILQVAKPSDMLLKDPPCLRHIDTRIQDGKLHFFPYFRSWDLFGGFPANLAAIELMKQYCADEIGVQNGEIIASSKGLHLYSYVWEIAEAVRGRKMEEFREVEVA